MTEIIQRSVAALTVLLGLLGSRSLATVDAFPADWPTVNGSAVEPDHYRQMKEYGFLPLKTTFLSDEEIAQKLDLSLPDLADIKAALDKKDSVALKASLISYL